MPEGKPAASDSDAEASDAAPLELDLDELRMRADVEGVLSLAKAYRSGALPGGRDLKRCFEAYRVAAELGSADAEYALALFCMTGGVVPQDLKEGATRLRAAAEKGSVPAKVYLGNLYELGIHYKADHEKADVWYRNAARGARVAAEDGTDAFQRALAELGCVRYVLELVESGAASGDDEARLLQRARAHGYALAGQPRPKDAPAPAHEADATPDESTAEPAKRPKAPELTPPSAVRSEPRRATTTSPAKADGTTPGALALGAFGYAFLFVVTGIGAAYAATLGARELVAHGQSLPGLGTRSHLVFPIVLGVVGVLPTWLVYRFMTVIKAMVMGAAIGGIGWVLWGTGQASLSPQRPIQALVFAIGGFLAGLCVLGYLGGTKKQPAPATPVLRR